MARVLRHWKQKWDPRAEFVFTRRVRVGPAKAPWAAAGSPVDKALYARLLKKWWKAGLIAIKDWTPARGRAALRDAQVARKAPVVEVVPAPETGTDPAVETDVLIDEATTEPAVEETPLPDATTEPAGLVALGSGWYELPDGTKVQGKAKAEAALAALES